MAKKGKIIGAIITAGIFAAGGLAGGIALANINTAKQIAEAEDKGYQEGHKDGYEQGTSEAGYTEEDLENAKDEGREEAESEYLAALSILTSQDKQENSVNENLSFYYSPTIPGLVVHNKLENKFYPLRKDGSWTKFDKLSDDNILAYSSEGILYFNIETYDTAYYATTKEYKYKNELSNGDVLLSGDSKSTGLLLLDNKANKFELVYSSGNLWQFCNELSNGNALVTSNNNEGILIFDGQSHEVTWVFLAKYSWKFCFELPNGNVLLSSSSATAKGIALLDMTQKSTSKVYTLGYNWDTFVPDEQGVTISSSKNTEQGKVYYNFETQEIQVV